MSVNKAILVGNLGADPEARQTSSGSTVTNLRVATNERKKDASGEWVDHTEWHRVVCFGRTAENAAKYLSKGRKVYVEGRIRTSKWEDKDGRDRWTTEVICDTLHFLGGQDQRDSVQRVPTKDMAREVGKAAGFDMSEIPF